MVDNQNDNEEENGLMYIYEWIDRIELSKPKKNMARDFCDGLLVAEIIKNYFPKLVELHNYPASSSMKQKNYNWTTLNTKVLKKIGMQMSNTEINDVIECKPLAIEHFLQRLHNTIQKATDIDLSPKVNVQSNRPGNQQSKSEGVFDGKKTEEMRILEEKEINVKKLREIVKDLEIQLERSNNNIRAQEMKVEELTRLAKSRGLNV